MILHWYSARIFSFPRTCNPNNKHYEYYYQAVLLESFSKPQNFKSAGQIGESREVPCHVLFENSDFQFCPVCSRRFHQKTTGVHTAELCKKTISDRHLLPNESLETQKMLSLIWLPDLRIPPIWRSNRQRSADLKLISVEFLNRQAKSVKLSLYAILTGFGFA